MSYPKTVGSVVPTISIVTATYNAAALLPRLVVSLKAQTDQDFEWVVADGGSIDNSMNIINESSASLKHVVVSSQSDFGIYDALNRAIKMAQGDYYVVIGADDVLHPEAIANYRKAIISSGTDLVTAKIRSGFISRGPRDYGWTWLYGQFAHVSGHAVGLAIRSNLHQKVGYYSRKLPIAADQLFILKAIKQGASVSFHDFEAGYFEAVGGTSGQDVLGTLLEGYRVQLAIGQSRLIQTILLLIRLIKNWRSIRSGL